MNKYINIAIVILVFGIFATGAVGLPYGIPVTPVASIAGNTPLPNDTPVVNANETPLTPNDTPVTDDTPVTNETPIPVSDNISKISVVPQYSYNRLQPCESKEIIVRVKNGENEPISVTPNISTMPGLMTATDWITVEPDNIEIPAKKLADFTINVSIPTDADVGNYGVQIAFSEAIQPFTSQPPIYTNAIQLSIEVWKPPTLQIDPQYISDQPEAGNEFDYEVNVKNVGNNAIGISPKLIEENIVPYGMSGPILTEEHINISAPDSIAPDTIETIKIHTTIPDARGYFNGYIDLRPDDPSAGEARIGINLNIWKQPTEPLVKIFNLNNSDPIKLEISSYYNNYSYLKTKREEPSFDANLVGPNGDMDLDITKTVIKGNVYLGGDRSRWEISNVSPYQEVGNQFIYTYKTEGSPGEWTLNILPKNTQGFDYSIIIGNDS